MLSSRIESILFVASKPLSYNMIAKALGVSAEDVRQETETLKARYNQPHSGIRILEIEDEIQMATNPDNTEAVAQFIREEASGELTKAQLETLTVIAYREPVTRPELEQIRGVNCALIVRNLMIRGLIEEKDSAEQLLPAYSLSFEALRHLGVTSVAELPEYAALHAHSHIEHTLEHVD